MDRKFVNSEAVMHGIDREWMKRLLFSKTYGQGFQMSQVYRDKPQALFWEQRLDDEYNKWLAVTSDRINKEEGESPYPQASHGPTE